MTTYFENLIVELYLYYYLRGFPCLDSSFFCSKIPLCLSRDNIKGQFGKNATLISTKILPKKQDHFPINFQIDLFTYKLDFQKSILLFKGFSLFGFLIFQFKNIPIPLCLSRDKIKGQFGKNTTLISTTILPKKQDHFPINFQIDLFTYKLDFQNKNYIYIK